MTEHEADTIRTWIRATEQDVRDGWGNETTSYALDEARQRLEAAGYEAP